MPARVGVGEVTKPVDSLFISQSSFVDFVALFVRGSFVFIPPATESAKLTPLEVLGLSCFVGSSSVVAPCLSGGIALVGLVGVSNSSSIPDPSVVNSSMSAVGLAFPCQSAHLRSLVLKTFFVATLYMR